MANRNTTNNDSTLGFEETLWRAANQLRGHMDPSRYREMIPGLILPKYFSDTFNEKYEKLKVDPLGEPEDQDEYLASSKLHVPEKALWRVL